MTVDELGCISIRALGGIAMAATAAECRQGAKGSVIDHALAAANFGHQSQATRCGCGSTYLAAQAS
eukprot:5165333-Pyramimonas_sp.AAC.1